MGYYALVPLITNGFSWTVSLPWQTPAVVFGEYAALGLLHGYQAVSKWRHNEKASALFHSVAAIMGFVFPSYYLSHEMRLHHSSFGLLMMAIPSFPIQFLGSIITCDSSLYLLYQNYCTTDFMNLFFANYPLFVNGFTTAVIADDVNKSLSSVAHQPAMQIDDKER